MYCTLSVLSVKMFFFKKGDNLLFQIFYFFYYSFIYAYHKFHLFLIILPITEYSEIVQLFYLFIDIDECARQTDTCTAEQRCENNDGSYSCRRIVGCGTGYSLDEETQTCIGQ